jgi:tRNA(Leu) C34 or U34 (ribose-2'-O)-methylase TrmL
MRGYASIGLHDPRNPLNVGEVLRAAGCYQAAMVAATGIRYRRQKTDTQAAHKHLPLIQCDSLLSIAPYGAKRVGVELVDWATPIQKFKHPESAFYLFGPEDGSLPEEVLRECDSVIYIPTQYCMNLAATVNVVLFDRMAKE